MKALVCKQFGPVSDLSIEEWPEPLITEDQVLVELRAASLNFPDLLTIEGRYQSKPKLPFVPGAEGAGVITQVGSRVANFMIGDRVIVMPGASAYAMKVAVSTARVWKLPDNITFEQGAGIGIVYMTSHYALKQVGQIKRGETLLVLGAAGGVGSTAIQLGKLAGATVIAAASSEQKLRFAQRLGADLLIDYEKENLKERVKELTNGAGVDVIYDPVGGDYAEPAFRAMAWGGRFLVIGFAAGPIPHLPLNLPLLKGASVHGVWWGAWDARFPQVSANNNVELLEMVRSGALIPPITEVHPLNDFVAAFQSISERRALGKVILRIQA